MPNRTFHELPEALTTHIGYLLVILGKKSQKTFTDAIKPFGIRPPHFDILTTLEYKGTCNQTTISNTLKIEPGHMVKLLDELQKKGHIERVITKSDRRSHDISLTPSGKKILKTLKTTASVIENFITSSLNEKEKISLKKTLQELAKTSF